MVLDDLIPGAIREFTCTDIDGPLILHTRWLILLSRRIPRHGLAGVDIWQCQCSWTGSPMSRYSNVLVIDQDRWCIQRGDMALIAAVPLSSETFAVSFVPLGNGFPERLFSLRTSVRQGWGNRGAWNGQFGEGHRRLRAIQFLSTEKWERLTEIAPMFPLLPGRVSRRQSRNT